MCRCSWVLPAVYHEEPLAVLMNSCWVSVCPHWVWMQSSPSKMKVWGANGIDLKASSAWCEEMSTAWPDSVTKQEAISTYSRPWAWKYSHGFRRSVMHNRKTLTFCSCSDNAGVFSKACWQVNMLLSPGLVSKMVLALSLLTQIQRCVTFTPVTSVSAAAPSKMTLLKAKYGTNEKGWAD